jgi:hypothetical protein
VKLGEVLEESEGQGADLAAGGGYPLLGEFGADLLALFVVDEARQTDEDLDVVAKDPAGRHEPRKVLGTYRDERPRWMSTARRADANRLVGDETSMLEGDHVSRVRLLNYGRPEAAGARHDAHFDTNDDALSAHRPTATFSFEAGDLLPQRREGRQ